MPHGILVDCGYVSLDVVGRSKEPLMESFCLQKYYVNVPYAICWSKVGSCNLGSELNCFAEQGVVLQQRTCITKMVGD